MNELEALIVQRNILGDFKRIKHKLLEKTSEHPALLGQSKLSYFSMHCMKMKSFGVYRNHPHIT